MDTAQRRVSKFNVTTKLLLLIFITVLIIIGVQTWFNLSHNRQRSQIEDEQHLQDFYNDYNDEVKILSRASATLALSLADRPDLQQLIRAKDRQQLLTLLTPIFATLKKGYNIVDLTLYQPDGTVFVHVHNPTRFGERLSHQTIAAALESQQTVSGVEIGPERLGIRSVAPIFAQGEFIGMVEAGMDYDQAFIKDLKMRSGADYKIWLTYAAATPRGLQPKDDKQDAPVPEIFYYASTNPPSFSIPAEVYGRVLANGNPEIQFVPNGNQEAAVFVAPLSGYDNRILGILEIAISRTETLTALQSSQITTLSIAGGLTLLALILTWLATHVVVLRPLGHLTAVARQQLKGDLTARVQLFVNDEFGQLGHTFNTLTSELETTLKNQENIIAERTEQLRLTFDIARRLSSILDLEQLLSEVINLVQDRFNLYHTHIYLLDESGENLVVAEGYGKAGAEMKARGHSIALKSPQSLVARAARSGRVVRVDQVRVEKGWLANPLLPETRSEMAIPIKLGEQVIGVLDAQSDREAAFDEQSVIAISAVANEIAVAVRNAQRFEETARALAEAEKVRQIYLQTGWQAYLPTQKTTIYQQVQPGAAPIKDELLTQVKQGTAQGQMVVITSPAKNGQEKDGLQSAVGAPLAIRGQVIGAIRVHDTAQGRQWTSEEIALIEAISEQMSLAIENARLFDETSRRARREQLTREITDKMRSSPNIESIIHTGLSELAKALDVSRTYVKLNPSVKQSDDNQP